MGVRKVIFKALLVAVGMSCCFTLGMIFILGESSYVDAVSSGLGIATQVLACLLFFMSSLLSFRERERQRWVRRGAFLPSILPQHIEWRMLGEEDGDAGAFLSIYNCETGASLLAWFAYYFEEGRVINCPLYTDLTLRYEGHPIIGSRFSWVWNGLEAGDTPETIRTAVSIGPYRIILSSNLYKALRHSILLEQMQGQWFYVADGVTRTKKGTTGG